MRHLQLVLVAELIPLVLCLPLQECQLLEGTVWLAYGFILSAQSVGGCEVVFTVFSSSTQLGPRRTGSPEALQLEILKQSSSP